MGGVEGGMGVSNLRLRNISLLLRWWWRLYTNLNCLWTEKIVILKKKPDDQDGMRWVCSGSFFWGTLLSIKHLFTMSTELDRNNQLVWAWGSNGVYSAKLVYTMLAGGGKIKWPFVAIWSYKIPPSVRIFVFLLLRNRILTHEVMVRRGFDISTNCESCNRGVIESTLHLFFRCPKAVRLWERMASILGVMLMHMDTTVLGTWQISVSRAAAAGMRKKQW